MNPSASRPQTSRFSVSRLIALNVPEHLLGQVGYVLETKIVPFHERPVIVAMIRTVVIGIVIFVIRTNIDNYGNTNPKP